MRNTIEIIDFESLLDENLFEEWADCLCQLGRNYADSSLPVVIWANAKRYALEILNSKKPALAFGLLCAEIRNQYDYDDEVYSVVVLCVYTMVCFNTDNKAYKQLQTVRFIDYDVEDVNHRVADILYKIDNKQIEIDYDYSKENGKIDNSAIDSQPSSPLPEENEQPEEPAQASNDMFMSGIAFRILDGLFQKANVSKEATAEKKAEFMSRLTGYSKKKFQNQYSRLSPLSNSDAAKYQMTEANNLLKDLGLDIVIE